MNTLMKRSIAVAVAFGLAGTLATTHAQQKSRLDTVKERGKLICGVNNTLPGFGFVDSNGNYSGMDVDFCKAVAAAVLGDAKKIEFVPLTAAARFTAVQSGQVDVVFRNTTYTSSRDGDVAMDFGPVYFYDGQGVMVKNDSPAKRIVELEGATICAIQGTTTEQNVTDFFKVKKKQFKLVTYSDLDKVLDAFTQGRCDAVTSDASQLAARKSTAAKGNEWRIMGELISKEPFAPFVAQNDSKWRDVVAWTVYATIYAEELKINSRNVDSQKTNPDPIVRRFIGLEGTTAKGFGLPADFVTDIIKAVGNYAEIYDRNLGPKTKLNIPRRLNGPFSAGGLLYSPPFR
jgi:general L-amino acid transport system substrate-binding protein